MMALLQGRLAFIMVVTCWLLQSTLGHKPILTQLQEFEEIDDTSIETEPPFIFPEEFYLSEYAPIKKLPVEYPEDNSYVKHPRQGDSPKRWTNATVPYTIDSAFTQHQRIQIAWAFKQYEDNTCIRFIPKESHHTSWLKILHDPTVCSVAHWCMNEGAQFAKFGGDCVTGGNIVRELGHALCMGHEESRSDWKRWTSRDCSCGTSLAKVDHNPLFNSTQRSYKLYDYLSSQQSQQLCDNGCIFPTQDGVTKCGSGGPLSVLDIEFLNELYNCNSGCEGYRYLNTKNIDPFSTSLFSAGSERNPDNVGRLNSCRAYHEGNIIPGKYNVHYGVCYVAYEGREYQKTDSRVEVLSEPLEESNGEALWVNATIVNRISRGAIRGGRTVDRETLYVARCKLPQGWTPGYFQRSSGAYTSNGGEAVKCTDDFQLLVCKEKSDVNLVFQS